VDVVTDAAHNVFLDILSSGGVVLFIPYCILVFTVTKIAIKVLLSKDSLSYKIPISLIWICYIIQSAFSINQIGLAIWGWLSAGCILSTKKNDQFIQEKAKKNTIQSSVTHLIPAKSYMFACISVVTGSLLILPYQLTESKWVYELRKNSVTGLMSNVELWPRTCGRYLLTFNALVGSDKYTEAEKLLRQCLKLNPNNFYATASLLQFNISAEEKEKLLDKLHKLDPLNPKYES
jgi:hypothetical protein